MTKPGSTLEQRVVRAAEAALAQQQFVSPVDVLLGLGWLAPTHVDLWRQGRIECLEGAMGTKPSKVVAAMAMFEAWARERGLEPRGAAYVARTRDRRPLRFSRDGDAASELSAVVVRFSRSRRRYERQGVLVEPEALASAEAERLADADGPTRRTTSS